MPVLLEIPMAQLVESLPAIEEFPEALLARTGVIGTALTLAETADSGDTLRCDSLPASLPGMTAEMVVRGLSQALSSSGFIMAPLP